MKCPNCEERKQQHKNGKTKAGSQRYRCYSCGCSYTPEKKEQGYGKVIRQKAIKLYIDGAGLRRTARQLGVHHRTVANWTKAQAEQLPPAPVPAKVEAAEFDELFTYMYSVEGNNAELRHYLARLARASRCFSRCPYALHCAVRLFVYYFNQRQLRKQQFPKYSFHIIDFVHSPLSPLPTQPGIYLLPIWHRRNITRQTCVIHDITGSEIKTFRSRLPCSQTFFSSSAG